MPIRVTLPGRGVLTFADGTPQSDIEATIDRDFPRTGEDVAVELAEDPAAHRNISDEDFARYKEFLDQKKSDMWETASTAAGVVGETISKGLLGLFEARNLDPGVAFATATEAGAQGTRQLYGMLAQAEDPNSVLFRFKDWITNSGSLEDQKKQWQDARDFALKSQALDEGQETLIAPREIVNNDVKNALSLVADPTLFVPGFGQVLGASRVASRVVGAATKGLAEGARTVTRPLAGAIDSATEAAMRASGTNAASLRAAAAATGTTGLVMGVPGVREAATVVGGVKLADKVAEIFSRAGENLAEGGSRIGPMESLGLAPNAGRLDKALATVGRMGGDTAIDVGLAGATGVLEGAAIGAGLGFLSGGEEGAAAGLGSGAVLGGVAGTGVRGFDTVRGKVAAENRLADLNRFIARQDPDSKARWEKIVEQDGTDAAANTMDIRNLLQGSLQDAKFTILNPVEFTDRFGADARGIQVITAGQPEVVINSGKMRSNYTAGHELFHALDAVEQLRPQAERIKQEIVGTFFTQPDGIVVQASQGLLSPAEVDVAFKQYQRKLAKSGIDTREWYKAKTPIERSRLVANELGAEYMGRLISGSGPDEMLRGYAGVTRNLLDMALQRDAGSRLRQLAERMGLGAAPVESMVFRGLKDASPALNGMLRDLVRARRNLSERIEVANTTGTVITPREMSSPVVANKAVAMGLAERRPDGSTALKPDDVLAREERDAVTALRAAVETAPVADPSKPHLRVVDDAVVGGGVSPEQLAAIAASPAIPNNLKAALTGVSQSLAAAGRAGEGNVIWIEYGAATKRVKNRLTGFFTSKYSSGIRLSQREIAPYALLLNKGDVPYMRVVDVSKLRGHAQDLASKGKLGPYAADVGGFLSDTVRYFENISNPSGVRTHELPGMTPEKASYLNSTFGQDEKGGAKFIRSIRLDRITEMRPTGERIAASELAWQRQKVDWMPAEKMPDGEVISSPQGYRIIAKDAKFSLYAPDGQRVGIYDTQAAAEAKAGKMEVANALPRRQSVSTEEISRDQEGNIRFKGKEPKDWTPEDFADYGKAFGVDNLGPLSEIRKVSTGLDGDNTNIPGGIEGKFTYYDLLWLKANPVDVAKLSEGVHAQLTAKLARTMAPEPTNAVQKFNGIVFGMLSPNAPLLPNEFAASRLRFGSMDDIRRFANLQPENPTAENKKKLNAELKKLLGMTSADKGGLGIGITADLSNIVNTARLFLRKPDFFVKRADESWGTFVDKVATQVKGLGTKTASFGGVWQDPLNASISAMDRHMARIFGQQLLGDKQLRARFEGIIVDRFNKLLSEAKSTSNKLDRKIAKAKSEKARSKLEQEKMEKLANLPDPTAVRSKTLDDVLGQAEIFGEDRVRAFVNEAVFAAMGGREGKLITAKGTVNPKAPENIRAIEWVETPQKFKVMSEAYRAALEMNAKRAKDMGVEVFPAQWTLWDRIRQRVEPHEVMFPGLEKLPALNDRQLGAAFEANKVAGYGITPEQGQTWRRGAVNSPSALAYFMPDDATNPTSLPTNPDLPSQNARPTRAIPKSRFYVSSTERGRNFADAIARAAQDHPRGVAVEVKPAEFYTDPENFLFLSQDGLAGAAVKADGDLVSVFKHPASNARMKDILADATASAIKLDAFDIDGFLPQLYSNFGFRPVARVAFADDFAPPRWNFEDMGWPDVLLMVKDPRNALGLPDATLYSSKVREQVPLVSYEDAVRMQSEAVAKLERSGGGARAINFQPEAMPNGTVYRADYGYSVVNKTGGKFRVFSPLGELIAVAKSLEEAERHIQKRL